MIVDIVGDVHGDFKKLKYMIESVVPKADYTIACGDFGYWPSMLFFNDLKQIDLKTAKLFFCDGNHENHLSLQNLGNTTEIHSNVFYIKRGTIVPLGETNFLFMGGADSIDKHVRTPGFDWFVEENISYKNIENFEENFKRHGKVDIVISHTCPNEFEIIDEQFLRVSDPNRDVLSYILQKTNPKKWYFGHWHIYKKGKYKDTEWTALSQSSDKFKNFKERIIIN